MSQKVFEKAIEDGDLTEEELHEILEDEDVTESKIRKQFDKFYEKARKIIDDKDKVKKILAKAKKIFERLIKIPSLEKYLKDIPTLCDMISDYIDKLYTDVPVWTIVGVLTSVIYFVSPIDLIPDTLIGLGFIDDAGFISTMLLGLSKDINSYREWRSANVETQAE